MNMFSRGIMLAACVALSACSVAKVEYPEHVKEAMPVNMPVRNITSFSAGLQCMDSMFIKYKVKPIRITAAQIPDFSEARGDAGFGAREMLISALSSMSEKSGVLRFVAYDRSTPDIIALQSAHPNKKEFMVPDFFIRGAVTQIDNSPYSKQKGYSLSADDIDEAEVKGGQLSNSNSGLLKTVAVDLNMGLINTFELLPGIYSANALSVEKRSSSDDVSMSIWKLGAIYTLNENKAQALSNGMRALMEVAAIELFGKLYNLPYWECLATLGDDSDLSSEARKTYEALNEQGRIEWIGNEFKRKNLLRAEDAVLRDGNEMTDIFRQALAHYRAKQNMFGSSQLTFEVFDSLYREKHFDEQAALKTSSTLPMQGNLPEKVDQLGSAPVPVVKEEKPKPVASVAPAPKPAPVQTAVVKETPKPAATSTVVAEADTDLNVLPTRQ